MKMYTALTSFVLALAIPQLSYSQQQQQQLIVVTTAPQQIIEAQPPQDQEYEQAQVALALDRTLRIYADNSRRERYTAAILTGAAAATMTSIGIGLLATGDARLAPSGWLGLGAGAGFVGTGITILLLRGEMEKFSEGYRQRLMRDGANAALEWADQQWHRLITAERNGRVVIGIVGLVAAATSFTTLGIQLGNATPAELPTTISVGGLSGASGVLALSIGISAIINRGTYETAYELWRASNIRSATRPVNVSVNPVISSNMTGMSLAGVF